MELSTYLTFNGNCREAMTFYEKCLGGELKLMTFGDSPMDVPSGAKERIMHAALMNGDNILMASDTMPGMPFQTGNNFSISLNCKTQIETERLFSVLAEDGKITMPLQETFWAERFGMVTDKFGINWMFNLEKPKH